MEEENFFYYLSEKQNLSVKDWSEEDKNFHTHSDLTDIDEQQEETIPAHVDVEEQAIASLTTMHVDQQDLDETVMTESSALLSSNHSENQATDTIRLLPPMNGMIDYSKLSMNTFYGSRTSSRNSLSAISPNHGLNGSLHGSRHDGNTGPMLIRGDSFFKPLSRKSSSIFEPLSKRASSFVEPFNDHSGKSESVIAGLFNLTVVGILIGIVMPQNEKLPTPWYRVLSSITGYTYFIFWCASFYPQVVMNFQRKSTDGLSIDYSVINFVGYICYTSYTSAFYWNKTIRDMYRERYSIDNQPAEITVESNDVAFAIHSLIMSIIWLCQLEVYGGFKKSLKMKKRIISHPIKILIQLIVGSCALYGALIICSKNQFWRPSSDNLLSHLNWLDFLYYLSYMKVIITTAKYIPQVLYNMKRKSCVGWNIW